MALDTTASGKVPVRHRRVVDESDGVIDGDCASMSFQRVRDRFGSEHTRRGRAAARRLAGGLSAAPRLAGGAAQGASTQRLLRAPNAILALRALPAVVLMRSQPRAAAPCAASVQCAVCSVCSAQRNNY